MSLVSVVIPAYNAGPYLAQAVDSVMRQTYTPLEVIVVDDGSTDDTEAVARSFGRAVRYLRQPNAGPSVARNTGLAHATGEYVTFVDADDVIRPQRIARLVDALRAAPQRAAFAVSDGWVWDGRRLIHRFDLSHPVPGERTLSDFLDRNRTIVGILARRSLLWQAGGFRTDVRQSEDYDLWLRLLVGGRTYIYVPDPLYLYRLHPASLSRNEHQLRLDACRVHQDALRTLPLTWGERRRLRYLLWRDRAHVHVAAARASASARRYGSAAGHTAAAAACQAARALLRPHLSLSRLVRGDSLRSAALQALDGLPHDG